MLPLTCHLLLFSPNGRSWRTIAGVPLNCDRIDWSSTELIVYLGRKQVARRGRAWSNPPNT